MSEIEKEASTGTVLVDPLGGLLLEPSNELKFRGPFDDYVTVSLIIKNPTEKRIAFKIKTTAPKRYCVKPNSGVLDCQQTMKPFNYDPNEKNKHKFMVQYMYLNENEQQLSVNDILSMWKDVPPTRLLDIKLKCLFEQPDSEQTRIDQSKPEKTLQSSRLPHQTKQETRSQSNRSSNFDENINNKFESAPSINSKSPLLNTNNNNLARLDKNDNLANELIQSRQENDLLKKEINKLKEEEARLRKLALQSPALNRQANNYNEVLVDLLHNRSSIVIIVLLAIIFYLMLFR